MGARDHNIASEYCDHGLPPEVAIPLVQQDIQVRLVHAKDNISRIVGYQLLIHGTVIATNNLYHPFDILHFKSTELKVWCKQLNGHLANDNKQIGILNGQPSCTVKHPMSCCMVSGADLGLAPEWI